MKRILGQHFEVVKTIAAMAGFVIVSTIIGIRTIRFLNTPGETDPIRFGLMDFRDVVYYPVIALLRGINPYDVEAYRSAFPVYNHFPPYSPLTMLIHFPFGLLPYELSMAVYFLFMLCLLLALAALILRCCGVEVSLATVFGLGAFMLASRPGYSSVVLGQSTALVTLAMVFALQYAGSRPLAAGVALAIATVKPQYGGPLAILLLVRGNFRAVGFGIGVAIAGAALPVCAILAASDGGVPNLIQRVSESYTALENEVPEGAAGTFLRIDVPAAVERFTGAEPSRAVTFFLTSALIVLCSFAIRRTKRVVGEADGADSLSGTLIVLTTLVSMYHLSYDTLSLWLPLVAVVVGNRAVWRHAPLSARLTMIAALVLPLINYLATYLAFDRLGIPASASAIIPSLNGMAVLLALAITMYLTLVMPADTTGR